MISPKDKDEVQAQSQIEIVSDHRALSRTSVLI